MSLDKGNAAAGRLAQLPCSFYGGKKETGLKPPSIPLWKETVKALALTIQLLGIHGHHKTEECGGALVEIFNANSAAAGDVEDWLVPW